MESHWTFDGGNFNVIPDEAYGFVYKITNIKTMKMYIGKKQFYSIRRKKIKGRKNRKWIISEMKWGSYTGSSEQLNEDILELGKDKFRFEILGIAYTKGQLNYLEEYTQFLMNVTESDRFYNKSIGSSKYRNLTIDDRFRQTLKKISI